MRPLDIIYYALRQINRRKARAATNILGYVFAVAVMVVLTHAVLASKQASDKILNSTGTHFVAFIPAEKGLCPPCAAHLARTQKSEGFVTSGTLTSLIGADFIKNVATLDGVEHAAPFVQYRLRSPGDSHLFTIGGFDLEDKIVVGTTCCADSDIIEGRFLGPCDNNAVMLEQAYAKLKNLRVGNTIDIAGETFTIVGIVNPGIRPAKADIYMLRKNAQTVISRNMGEIASPDPINVMLVEVASSTLQDQVIQSVKSMWSDLVVSSYACYKPAAKAMFIHRVAASVLIVVVAVGTVLLSMKSQLASLMEQRHDLGILKAIGWTNGIITWQLLAESAIQAGAGSILGVFAGAAMTISLPHVSGYDTGLFSNMNISIWVLAIALLLGITGGIVAAAFPSWVAARQQPSQLLRCI
jgi:ABC-type antimicrobial peptide transport system permease subunit